MRLVITIIAVAVTGVIASPKPPPPPKQGPGAGVAAAGPCPMDCWNEAAGVAKCDPNKDDKCLCGPFLNAVTSCTAATCSISENLAALDVLAGPCE
ncbi:hypothetical protein ACJQWK_01244 [Exserohilum turcicum]